MKGFIPYTDYIEYPADEMKRRSRAFREEMECRRTVRNFSSRSVPRKVVEDCIRAAGRAPSGANLQPWKFIVVTESGLRRRIRDEAEAVERAFYAGDSTRRWREDLTDLGTNESKPFLEEAPVLIGVFAETRRILPGGESAANPHAVESTCIALGFLLVALHHAGLAALCYTPNPPHFLRKVLDRPDHEHPLCLVVSGFPSENAGVPDIGKKPFHGIAEFI